MEEKENKELKKFEVVDLDIEETKAAPYGGPSDGLTQYTMPPIS